MKDDDCDTCALEELRRRINLARSILGHRDDEQGRRDALRALEGHTLEEISLGRRLEEIV